MRSGNEASSSDRSEGGDSTHENRAMGEEILPEREDAHALTVVGLGGSAGSIPALEVFFQSIPTEEPEGNGYAPSAYVVVVHLSPDFESNLAELLARSTTMPVQQVTRSMKMQRGHVYVIPPGKHLEMEDSRLHLRDLEPTRNGTRVAIDTFFRTLADAHGPQATAVVLSGTGSDGTLGIRQIKEVGGLTVAQAPGEAEFDAMPRNAIASGMIDYVLPAVAMPAQIAAYWHTSRQMRLPAEAAPSPEQRAEGPDQEASLLDILAHVRAQTGHDFALYKRATVLRRVGRRLQVNSLMSLAAYLEFLRSHPAEVGDLVGDLLISVTQFFRDPEAWAALERDVIPRLFQGKGAEDEVRVWICGCATGEEAYTLAILLLERAARTEQLNHTPRVQVFATDMDAEAIARARTGVYPETIANDVSEERLRRWFYRHNGSYQVRKELREIVLFASHDVLRDTPFSRLDLITCRNLLIYLNREAQERVFDTFHFALRPDGRLFLGTSESADSVANLFGVTDKQHRIYVRRPVARGGVPPIPAAPSMLPSGEAAFSARRVMGRDLAALTPILPSMPPPTHPVSGGRELLLSLLERYGPPTALVDEAHDIVHLSNGAGRFLRVGDGEPTRNLLQLVHPDLRIELRAALYAAAAEGTDQTRLLRHGATLVEGRPPVPIRLIVRPVDAPEGARGYFLVQFEELSTEPATDLQAAPTGPILAFPLASPDLARQLEEENATLQRQLRSTIEQYEAMTEELKASNEELQAMNEEQRSAAEELETSREELQSVNEELSTVNHELRARVEEVSRTNSDLQNFLASTDIGTLFLDRELRIKRYTPAAEALFNLIPTDTGRPLAHVTHRLNYPELQDDAERVLGRLAPVERETASMDGHRHFLARLLPYRSLDDRIEGVVLNFIDISGRKRAEQAMHTSEERLRLIIESARDFAIFTIDLERHVSSWNSGARAMFGYTENEIIGRSGDILFIPEDRESGAPQWEAETALAQGRAENERWHMRKDGSRFYGSGLTRPLHDAAGTAVGLVKIMRDLTESKRAEEALHESMDARSASEERFRLLVEGARDYAMFLLDAEGRITFWSAGAERLFGWSEQEALGEPSDLIFTPESRESGAPEQERQTALTEGRAEDRRWHIKKDGTRFWADGMMMRLDDEAGNLRGFAKIARDATGQKQAEEALQQAHDELEARVAERTEQLSATLEALETGLSERQRLREGAIAAQEEERRRISRELHDQTGQYLTGFALGLKNLEDRLSDNPATADLVPSLSALQTLVDGLTHDIHRIAVELRPTALDDLGLEPALRSYVEEWEKRTGVAARFESIGLEPGLRLLPPVAETAVYRVVQEALNNVARHAVTGGASIVTVTLQRFDDRVQVTVEDNGPGFDQEEAARSGRLGLAGMRERAELVGGTVEVESTPGEGTTVYLRVPIQRSIPA